MGSGLIEMDIKTSHTIGKLVASHSLYNFLAFLFKILKQKGLRHNLCRINYIQITSNDFFICVVGTFIECLKEEELIQTKKSRAGIFLFVY